MDPKGRPGRPDAEPSLVAPATPGRLAARPPEQATAIPRRSPRLGVLLACALLALGAGFVLAAVAGGRPGDTILSWPQAVALGAVEGITEFLPVSSTAHLLITERLFGLGGAREALDGYAIVIQGGAILAVAGVYRRRLVGSAGAIVAALRLPFRPEVTAADRRLAAAIVLASAPAGIVGLVGGDTIKTHLFSPVPIAIAWAAGGLALLGAGRWLQSRRLAGEDGGTDLEWITAQQALLVGLAQVLALWPGISRSLVTIVAGCLVGLALPAAVELSFLVGFVVLVGATGLELVTGGGAIVAAYGWLTPLLGVAVAFLSAVVAIRWLLRIVSGRSLAGFGWYRLAAAAVTLALVASGSI